MSRVIALIPARSGSKGIPDKNFKPLAGRSPMNRAIDLCNELCGALHDYYVSSDIDWESHVRVCDYGPGWRYGHFLLRPPALAQDGTPMIDVVKHALEQVPGKPDDIWVLLQPTQPLRKPAHVREAIRLLQESEADSVVSVKALPLTHHPLFALEIYAGRLSPWSVGDMGDYVWLVGQQPSRRQDVEPVYIRDGTVYAFYRRTVEREGNIYGKRVIPLIIPPEETCELDTPEDWARLEARVTHAE
jgi:CMP-N,N'-diacetyllegionaminic acid synthase